MSEIISASSPIIRSKRLKEYSQANTDGMSLLGEYIDNIIELSLHGRLVMCQSELMSEWCELEALATDDCNRLMWPLTTMRLNMRRDIVPHNNRYPGDNYAVIVEWLTHRDDLEDPKITKAYSLMIPHEATEENPQLLMCYQPSLTVGGVNGQPATTDTNESAYHEIDTLLDDSFYSWQRCTRYDVDQLMDELAIVERMLLHQ